ncbi:16S rRNA (guanine(966)-N(2))-methyltransferase RsmD [Parahaliea mediterranea]|uniref:Ribosomal RNA small subunit methyltransferase D n=1 Tax=Parahaliea mediterranea TaxID=651086 RepID=A0A939IKF1_9GAMM|nr:16S rRNA (guanine(966)-N(2))-methyltransferase RsmD [Parahaliea mediterranea]MBN7797266.1 16S rRNA (guanine(966)-N(2))-methyltransferase RsmD [Parahaliea mediterranea]
MPRHNSGPRGAHQQRPGGERTGRGGDSRLRIIGGRWRGRKLAFTPAEGLRPTTDRVRETLFNWLAPDIRDARCLDLFCGSGALGLEALSRGARHCDFVDTNSGNLQRVVAHLETLEARSMGTCHGGPADRFLEQAAPGWDIVFIDPPFEQGLAAPACRLLDQRKLLRPGARIYLETGAGEASPELPADWHLHREKRAGGVIYRLYFTPGDG